MRFRGVLVQGSSSKRLFDTCFIVSLFQLVLMATLFDLIGCALLDVGFTSLRLSRATFDYLALLSFFISICTTTIIMQQLTRALLFTQSLNQVSSFASLTASLLLASVSDLLLNTSPYNQVYSPLLTDLARRVAEKTTHDPRA